MKKLNKTIKNSDKAITLIALVVTIIVLLILAGISISILTGNNGIIYKTTEAKERTGKAKIIETTQTDILEQQIDNKSGNITKEQLATILNRYFETIDPTILPNEVSSEHDVELTTNDGNYKINLSEIFKGKFKRNIVKISVENLNEGDQIVYIDKDGNEIPCSVLYDSKGSYGIQIITSNIISTVTLGKNDTSASAEGEYGSLDRAAWSYNNSINTLNNIAEEYRQANILNITDSARCVGSIPNNPYSRNTSRYEMDYITLINAGLPTNFGDKFEEGDSNYITDKNQMDNLAITKSNGEYWLASRETKASIGQYVCYEYVNIRTINSSGALNAKTMVGVCDISGEWYNSETIGLRPVFTLKSDVYYYIEENGTKIIVE